MAGADSLREETGQERVSLPLYLSGLVATLCGILAANVALPSLDYTWMTTTLLLVGMGFLFSFGSRWIGIPARYLDLGYLAVALLLLAGILTGQFAPEQFLPVGADNSNLRMLVGLAWLSILWSWALRSDHRVVFATVPAMAILGLAATVDLNDPVKACFCTFILTVIFLLIHQNYLQNRTRADMQERAQAPRRLLLSQFVQAGLCAVLVFVAGLAVIVPAQALFARLSLAQTIRQLAAIGQGTPAGGSPALHFSDDDNLSIGTGDAWSASAEVMMQVTPSDGQEHLWRGRTYDVYTGDGWQSSLENDNEVLTEEIPSEMGDGYTVRPDLTPGDFESPSEPLLTASFNVIGDTGQFYYAAAPRQVILGPQERRDGRVPRVTRDGRIDLSNRKAVQFPYVVTSHVAPDPMEPAVQDQLRQEGPAYPREVRQRYLGVASNALIGPDDITFYGEMLAEAVQNLPPSRRDPLDETLAIRAWVSRRCIYTLFPPPIPADADHVHTFLGDTRRGYCDMFASSMTVLCRMAGVPARLATGFAPGERDGVRFNLRAEDRHAWTEVYFPRSGWVAFDPTAGSQTDGSIPNARTQRGGWLSRLRLSVGSDWLPIDFLLTAIVLILAYVLKTEVYDRRRARSGQRRGVGASESAHTVLGQQYARMTRALARLGLPRRLAETPGEYAARVAPLLAKQEQESEPALSPALLTALTGAFVRACYGGPEAASLDQADWDPQVTRLDAAARRIWRGRLWGRILHLGRERRN